MANVDKIGFNFHVIDEAFIRNLYVEWDNFYRDAFEEIVDEFLSRHNEDGRLLRLNKLELNLGNIPQEDFYLLFPVRLREELERVFLFLAAQDGVRETLVEQIARRLACLKFYLEKGFCPTEWEGAEFELEKEIRFLLPYAPVAMSQLFHESVRQPNQLYRLKWSLPNELFGNLMLFWLEDKSISRKEKEQRYTELRKIDSSLEPSLYKMQESVPRLSERLTALLFDNEVEYAMAWLSSTTVSAYEKRRILSGLLEWQSIIIIRYIRETQDEKNINSLAVLLDKVMVRQIIFAECEDHTEADVPAYWVYLYSWLLKYYPFNGIYMFGNKLQFQEYLHIKLLGFIRKRSYSAFLSKTDITIQFLVEVFGQEYYREVLNIIYDQQARNADGSPVYTDCLNMELYYMFLHLSLLKESVQPKKNLEYSVYLDEEERAASIQFFLPSEPKILSNEPAAFHLVHKEQREHEKKELPPKVMEELFIKNAEDDIVEKNVIYEPKFINVTNAGLVLLTPWFPRLFGMFNFLREDKKDFKDLESRIRAIFLIQRLVTYDDREYKESELAFNRILVGCPFSEPLPPKMELTEDELETIESMLNGIRGNWSKVQNISIRGFQHNFIERGGYMEQKQEKWLLSVEPRAYDMLLDSIPWTFNRVIFPWLSMPIHVSWRDKQVFSSNN